MALRQLSIPIPLVALLAACHPASRTPSSAPKIPVPPFQQSFIPLAEGAGNFEACLSDEASDNGIRRVVVPAGMIFQSWGQLTDGLRKSQNFDLNVMGATAAKDREGLSFAVALDKPIVLTLERPCRIGPAHAVTHEEFRFEHEIVPAAAHLSFQAERLRETQEGDIKNDGHLGDERSTSALELGLVLGTPVGDIGNAHHLHDAE